MSTTTIILLLLLAVIVVAVLSVRPGSGRNPRQAQVIVWVVLLLAVVAGIVLFVLRPFG